MSHVFPIFSSDNPPACMRAFHYGVSAPWWKALPTWPQQYAAGINLIPLFGHKTPSKSCDNVINVISFALLMLYLCAPDGTIKHVEKDRVTTRIFSK